MIPDYDNNTGKSNKEDAKWKILHLRLKASEAQALSAIAAMNRRSLNGEVRIALREYILQRGRKQPGL